MVSDEKTPLLGHVVLVLGKEPAAAALTPAPLLPLAVAGDAWCALTNRELLAMANDPFWVRVRAVAFWCFWVTWAALFTAALCIVLTSPPCAEVDCANATDVTTTQLVTDLPTTVTLEAWTTMVPP